MTNMVDCWRYPGTDEPSGFCAFKAVCPNKQSFKMAIQKEYGEEYTEDEIESIHAVRFGVHYRFVDHKTPKSLEMWRTID